MKKFFSLLFLSVIILSFFASCEEEDGAWAPMKWYSTTKLSKDTDGNAYVNVPAEGGVYSFACTNYDGFWLSQVTEHISEDSVYLPYDGQGSWNVIQTQTAKMEIEGNVLTVTVKPNTTGKECYIKIQVTAGDIFDDFTLKQQKR